MEPMDWTLVNIEGAFIVRGVAVGDASCDDAAIDTLCPRCRARSRLPSSPPATPTCEALRRWWP